MHHRLPLLASRIFNEPLMIHPGKGLVILNAIGPRLGVGQVLAPGVDKPSAFFFDDDDDFIQAAPPAPYDLVQDTGIALIPIDGTLVHKNGTIRPSSGMTGYDGIRNAFLAAQGDTNVRAIVLQIDSFGGECSGCFDLVDLIASFRGAKPCWAVLDDCAYSAAYAIACAADHITVPRSGGTGSIGTIVMHADLSGALAKEGVVVSIIQFGAHKADGNAYQALPPDVRDRIQQKIDYQGELFVETVAMNRKLAASTVRGTEAATLMPAEALQLGLVDAIMAPDAALSALLAQISR